MSESSNPSANHSRPNGQGATILLLGFLILLISCALILTVRVHARLGKLTEELIKLNARISLKEQGKEPPKEPAKTPAKDGAPKDNAAKDGGAKDVAAVIGAGRAVEFDKKDTELVAPDESTITINTTPAIAAAGRSPIPQPGETFDKPLPARILAEKSEAKPIAPPPGEGEIIPWDQAKLHMGRTITIEGKVVATSRLASICFLNFTHEQGGGPSFYLVIFKDQYETWGGKPDEHFRDKTIRVTGKVEDHQGRPQMKILAKEQVLSVE